MTSFKLTQSGGLDCVGTLSSLSLRTEIVIIKCVLFGMLEVRPMPHTRPLFVGFCWHLKTRHFCIYRIAFAEIYNLRD